MKRESVEAAVRDFYAARLSNALPACLGTFSDSVEFRLAGAAESGGIALSVKGRSALSEVVSTLVNTYRWLAQDVQATIVDGTQVAIRYRLRAEHVGSGRKIDTEVMDHLEFDEALKVRSFVEFVDTALFAGFGRS